MASNPGRKERPQKFRFHFPVITRFWLAEKLVPETKWIYPSKPDRQGDRSLGPKNF